MRIAWLAFAGLSVLLLPAVPAAASSMPAPVGKADKFVSLHEGDETVPMVSPGDEIGIACDALEYTAPANDVRVVLTISSTPGDLPSPGYKKVLATDEELSKGAVRVKIPEVPDLANRTVNVDVYVVNAAGAEACDAGHMRIGERLQHPKGKKS